jgi:hypothetical protein
MILNKIKQVIIILILFISGCTKKDELTLPVKIHLKIGSTLKNPEYVDFPEATFFEYTSGRIAVQKILFEGIREAGGDVFFETDPEIDSLTLGFKNRFESISDFDIPQGIYNTFKWDIRLKRLETNELIDTDDTAFINTGLIIKGYYNHVWWSREHYGITDSAYVIPFILAIHDTETFSFITSNIVLSENKDYVVNLLFDFAYAFDSISSELFEEAEISGDSLNQLVIISKGKNKYWYDIILNRVRLSSRLYIY